MYYNCDTGEEEIRFCMVLELVKQVCLEFRYSEWVVVINDLNARVGNGINEEIV